MTKDKETAKKDRKGKTLADYRDQVGELLEKLARSDVEYSTLTKDLDNARLDLGLKQNECLIKDQEIRRLIKGQREAQELREFIETAANASPEVFKLVVLSAVTGKSTLAVYHRDWTQPSKQTYQIRYLGHKGTLVPTVKAMRTAQEFLTGEPFGLKEAKEYTDNPGCFPFQDMSADQFDQIQEIFANTGSDALFSCVEV